MENCGTIVVVDRDEKTRAAGAYLGRRLGHDVLVCDDENSIEEIRVVRPVLALVDVEHAGPMTGLELVRELHECWGDEVPLFLVAATRTSPHDRIAGFLLGADDYLTKPLDTDELLARARRSLRRARPPVRRGNGNGSTRKALDLSPRERQILTLMSEGKTQGEIAAALVISPKTVATYVHRLLGKLGVHSRAQAVAAAFQLGLVEAAPGATSLPLL